ncbi:MAG: soluble lytic murein transglycosylase [Yoonia sp.]|jgi:soluble lytic murein transglycosylase
MREGRAQSAYDLASKHFLTDGSAFADLEWVAGYVALTYLDDPTLALTHFQAANAAVASPISVGRMQYWIGRSYEVLDNQPAAVAAYRIAAQHQTGFYGLLAAEKLGLSLDAALTGAADPTDWQDAPFMSDDLTRAALTLLQAGERGHAVRFFAELGKQLPPDDLARLGAWLRSKDEAYYAVLLGKTAVARGVLVPSIYFPLHDLADMEQPVPPALSLSIARRESEFNAVVGSPVGALGLMQLMPATAKEVAGFIGEPYSRARLTSDWAYNARLGSKYLSMLEEDFGYSPVMMAAGYNAGPSRPKAWMDERGDPRVGEVNVVDWIEHIPFRETRNYVMRVTESIPVYEARLTSKVGPIRFTDLLIGVKPIVRPRPRPAALDTTPVAAPEPEAPASRSPAAPSAPAPVASIRPISRPGG